jgi:alanine dehydrogenase
MKIGVPTETKVDEYRVALTPAGARELAEHGHEVVIQAGASCRTPRACSPKPTWC